MSQTRRKRPARAFDGAPLEFDAATRIAMLAHDATRCETPEDFDVLAAAPPSREWDEPEDACVERITRNATLHLLRRA